MRFLLATLFTVCFSSYLPAQSSIAATLEKFNKNTVAYISVDELKVDTTSVLLDTRKREEYQVSHLENAFWVGHKSFEINEVQEKYPKKDTPIVVYCSIGVRSETIGEKLLKAGYTNVKNLYGGIFEWKNEENPVFDSSGNATDKIHAFSKHWGKLLTNGDKIYTAKSKNIEK